MEKGAVLWGLFYTRLEKYISLITVANKVIALVLVVAIYSQYKSPGFCHAKMSVSDDVIATCGTINLDYRSFYHHFEDGCLMIGNDAVMDIKKDFDATLGVSTEVTQQYINGIPMPLRIGRLVLRLLAPLM